MSEHIEFDAPNLDETEKEYLNRAIESGFISTYGPYVKEFEQAFARRINVSQAVSLQSGTAALHMAMVLSGIGPGDEVVVPAMTFVASVNPVIYQGATPVFVDVDPESWTLSPERITEAITNRTRAIVPVHLYGVPCDMDAIISIADAHGLKIIEDATESLGTRYRDREMGTFGDFGCFSFNGNKMMTTGGGGMIVGRRDADLDHIRFLSNQAKEGWFHPEIGYNYRMTNLEAVLGLAQLSKLDRFIHQKTAYHHIYRDMLGDISSISFQQVPEQADAVPWLTGIIIHEDIAIDQLQQKLKAKGIPSRRLFEPITSFPPYKKYPAFDVSVSQSLFEHGLCLPGSTLNEEDDIKYICKELSSILNG